MEILTGRIFRIESPLIFRFLIRIQFDVSLKTYIFIFFHINDESNCIWTKYMIDHRILNTLRYAYDIVYYRNIINCHIMTCIYIFRCKWACSWRLSAKSRFSHFARFLLATREDRNHNFYTDSNRKSFHDETNNLRLHSQRCHLHRGIYKKKTRKL